MRNKSRPSAQTVLAIVFLIICLLGYRGVRFLFLEKTQSLWNGENNLALAVIGKENFLFYFNQGQNRAIAVRIPKETLFLLGEGEYPLDSILRFEQYTQKRNFGAIAQLFSRYFALPIKGVIVDPNLSSYDFDLRLSTLFWKKTNLSFFDYLALKSRDYQLKGLNLREIDGEFGIINVRSEKSFRFDKEKIDSALRSYYLDPILRESNFHTKLVFPGPSSENSTYWSRLIANLGWKLADVEFSQPTEPANMCFLKEESPLEKFLENAFDCGISYDSHQNYSLILRVAKNKF